MTTGQQLVDAASTFLGEPYSTAPGRTSPTSGYKDCSGLIAAAFEVATGEMLGAYVSVTIYDLCARAGLAIPFGQASGIAGACLLIPDDPYQGWGPYGHIGFSTGDGWTVEATPAARGGVQRLPLRYRGWGPYACLLPGIDYTNGGQGSHDQEDLDTMQIAVGQTIYGVSLAGVVDGGLIGDVFAGPPGAFGIPQDALDWNAQPGRGLKYVYLDPDRLAAALTPRQTVTIPGDCPDCPPGLDTATPQQLAAQLVKLLG